ncbi:MAG: WD40 repeat domain-containing protein, partial [Gemmataceae bacterium]
MLLLTLLALSTAPPPADPLALLARSLLERHCARCHHGPGRAKGGLGHVLDHHALVAAGKVPLLLARVEAGEMPPGKHAWAAHDTAMLRAWVRRGAPPWGAPSGSVLPLSAVRQLVAADLDGLPPRDRRFARYLSMGHLGAAAPERLDAVRHAVAKLVNSLSWHARLTAPVPIDAARLVYRLDLRDYRWDARLWDRLAAASPYRPGEILRADWFVATASRPPFYHDFLGLPATDRALERVLGVDVAADLADGRAVRAGFNDSGVARFNRVLQRHDAPHGAYWRSHDFSDNTGRQNAFESPTSFRPAGGEMIFHLPNGLQGYFIADADGRRIDKAPGDIVQDPGRPDRLVESGLSCIGCHAPGIHPKDDRVRAHVAGSPRAFPADVRDAVEALYVPKERFARLVKEDNERFTRALTALKIPAGPEPVLAAVLGYERVVPRDHVAAELDLTPGELERLKETDRALGGDVAREVIEQVYARLARGAGPSPALPEKAVAVAVAYGHDGGVVYATAEREVFVAGEPKPVARHPDEVRAVALHGRHVASASGRDVLVHERGGRLLHRLRGHTAAVRALAFTRDGAALVSAGEDRAVRVWDLGRGVEAHALAG